MRRPEDPLRLNEENAEYTGCKLGTRSTSVWIYEDDFPLEKGDVIRYVKRENRKTKRGRVIADPDTRYLFIAVDENAPLLDED